MSPSEQKTFLMMYKSQIERELAQLNTILNEHLIVVLPEAITGVFLYNLSENYLKSLKQTIEINREYLKNINNKLKEIK